MGVTVKFYRGSWWLFIRHRGQRKSKRIGDRETAQKVARSIRERIAAGDLRLGAVGDDTLETYARAWLAGLSGNLKASTIAFYSDNLRRHVLPALGARPISTLARKDCRDLVATIRGKGLRLNTVRGITRTLSAVLSSAVEDDKLPANPALRMGKYLRRGDEPERVIQPLTAAEAAHV